MSTKKNKLPHAPSHLREEFLEWLDSHKPDNLKEINIGSILLVLNALSKCSDVLPDNYCDQLDIPKGSTFAEAGAVVRRFHEERKKFYRVTYRSKLLVSVDVEATSKEEAEAKADTWVQGLEGSHEVGAYWAPSTNDSDFPPTVLNSDDELYWTVVDYMVNEAVEVVELRDDNPDDTTDDGEMEPHVVTS